MASSGVGVSAGGPASEAPEIPDSVGDWLRGVYRFATDRNDFRRHMEPEMYLNLQTQSFQSVTITRLP